MQSARVRTFSLAAGFWVLFLGAMAPALVYLSEAQLDINLNELGIPASLRYRQAEAGLVTMQVPLKSDHCPHNRPIHLQSDQPPGNAAPFIC